MPFGSLSFSSFPKDFQKDILTKISSLLKKGESVQLVGTPGSGTSTIVRLITQVPEISTAYFPKSLNFHLERNSLTLSRLLLSLFGAYESIPQDNVAINQKLTEEIRNICLKGKLVIIIDHIQNLNFPELKPFFTNLSYIYNKFRFEMCFLFVSERSLIQLKDLNNFGYLGRLLTSNIIYNPPLGKKDSKWFLKEIEKFEQLRLNNKEKDRVYELSGGIPRTMRRLVEGLSRGNTLDDLIVNPTLYTSLSIHLEELLDSGDLKNESQILKAYKSFLSRKDNGESLNGIEIGERMTKLEAKLLNFLIDSKGEIVHREKGIEKLWGNKALDISDHAYDQIVHRLRQKLIDSKPKILIKTVRGRGHMFTINR